MASGHLADTADPDVHRWNGRSLAGWEPAREYGFTDADGSRPDWGRYFADAQRGAAGDPRDYR